MKRMTLRLNKTTEAKINYFKAYLERYPMLINQLPSSDNYLLNKLLNDYLTIILNVWEKSPKKKYETMYRGLITSNGDPRVDTLIRYEHEQMDRLNEILYLLISTNQAFVRVNKDDWKDIRSMFEFGTKENEIYAKLVALVQADNKKLFGKKRADRK